MEPVKQSVVLVVDDEDAYRELCRQGLELSGYRVLTASGGREALEVLASTEVDAIVCDIQMPFNGLRVYEYILAQRPDLRDRFIFVTGNAEKKAEAEQLTRAAVCLLKPFSVRALVETMRSVLDGA